MDLNNLPLSVQVGVGTIVAAVVSYGVQNIKRSQSLDDKLDGVRKDAERRMGEVEIKYEELRKWRESQVRESADREIYFSRFMDAAKDFARGVTELLDDISTNADLPGIHARAVRSIRADGEKLINFPDFRPKRSE